MSLVNFSNHREKRDPYHSDEWGVGVTGKPVMFLKRLVSAGVMLVRCLFGEPASPWQKKIGAVRLRKGDVTIDCGANVGEVTRILARRGSIVYAFEPNPEAFRVLRCRFEKTPHVTCIQKAVADRDGSARLYLHEHAAADPVYWSTGSSLLSVKSNIRTDTYVEVELVDLADFIKGLGRRVRLLKMDVEGLEPRILKKLIDEGVIDLIDHAFVETHDDRIPSLKEETDEIRHLIQQKGLRQVDLSWI